MSLAGLEANYESDSNHQRDYSWTDEHIEQFFDDITNAIEVKSPEYFLGLMVFLSNEDIPLTVLDGQQRLATTMIAISAIRDWLKQYTEFQSEAGKIEERYIGFSEIGDSEILPRMELNAANNPAFSEFVIKTKPLSVVREKLKKIGKDDQNRKLLEAIIDCHKRVGDICGKHPNQEAAARYLYSFLKYINESVKIVRLVVSNEATAYTIFETLNDRGSELSPLDLVKNYLFGKAKTHSSTRVRDLESRWAEMMSSLSHSKSDAFLKVFWTSRHGIVQKTSLFDLFKRSYPDAPSALAASVEMREAADFYSSLDAPDDPVWLTHTKESRELVAALKILGAQQSHPVILSALGKFAPNEMQRLLSLLEIVVVRFQMIGRLRPGIIEKNYGRLARMIHQGEVTTATQAFSEVKELYTSDPDFEYSFQSYSERENRKAQYILRRLEIQKRRSLPTGQGGVELVPAHLTVEHILPKNPGPDWQGAIVSDPEFMEDCTLRLGNMCLLTEANKSLGNRGFDVKKHLFVESSILLTKDVGRASVWNRAAVDDRQKRLAKLAVATWRFQ